MEKYADDLWMRFEAAEAGGVFGDDAFAIGPDASHNHCPDCAIPMEIAGVNYNCPQCGLSVVNETLGDAADTDDIGPVRINTGSRSIYNVGGSSSAMQRRAISAYLYALERVSPVRIPKNILESVINQYNSIQKATEGTKRKFVRRSDIKKEILAAMIYSECRTAGVPLKKQEISTFMKLKSCGFSIGDDILRDLAAEGLVKVIDDEEPIAAYAGRYLETLNIEDERYLQFVVDIVQMSETMKLCMSSQISSKVAGAIYLLSMKAELGVSAEQLEVATSGTKKNTFCKFYKAVCANLVDFEAAFVTHGIPII